MEMEKAIVTQRGRALLARMEGRGWKLRVWENLGWHYEVVNGSLFVIPVADYEVRTKYFALLSRSKYGGEVFWTEDRTYSDPNAAVRRQIKVAKKFISDLTVLVEGSTPKKSERR